MAYPHGSQLASYALRRFESAYEATLVWRNAQLPERAWHLDKSPVCVVCLRRDGYLDYDCDFAHLPVCTKHSILLHSHCPRCKHALTWSRPSLNHCGDCSYDLRLSSAVEVDAATVTFSAAQLRFAEVAISSPGSRMVVSAADFLALLEVLTLFPREPFRKTDYPSLREVASDERLASLESLAAAAQGSETLTRDRLVSALLRPFPWLAPFDSDALQRAILRKLLARSQLSGSLRRFLLYGYPEVEAELAAWREGRSLPALSTERDLAQRLGVELRELVQLRKWLTITTPVRFEGFDGDEVLAARDYLDGFSSFESLDLAFGIEGVTAALVRMGLLSAWQLQRWSAPRVSADGLLTLLLTLHERAWHKLTPVVDHQNGNPVLPVPAHDGEAAAGVLAGLLHGNLTVGAWRAPYRVADILVSHRSPEGKGGRDSFAVPPTSDRQLLKGRPAR
jgi:hypothetical protein